MKKKKTGAGTRLIAGILLIALLAGVVVSGIVWLIASI